jgi:oligoendopeptidase F
LDNFREVSWQRQLHLFEVPFYYIEYGIAQLGAIGMWKQYKENPRSAIDNYITALAKGGTQTLPELYKTAGLPFDFSPARMKELMDLVRSELASL